MPVGVHEIQYSLNNGEVSYRYESRGDLKEYGGSLFSVLNFYALTVGGQRFRNGTRYVAQTALDGVARPIPFVFNKYQSYVLEVGDFYMRIRHVDGTLVTTTPDIVTPWPVAMLPDLYYFQSADVMYICSDGTLPVYKLVRVGVEEFQLFLINFFTPGTVLDEPTGTELGAGTLTPGATSGNGVTFTASLPGFVLADRTRIIRYLASVAVITAYVSPTQVTADIINPFPNTSAIPADDWRLSGTPDGTLHISRKRTHDIVDLDYSVTDAIRPRDVGNYIAVWGGFIKVIEYVDPVTGKGLIVNELVDLNPNSTVFPQQVWTQWRDAWTADFGYPTCGTFYQGRMFLLRDQTIWGSLTNDIENFALGTGDDAGINRTISDEEVNTAQWISATNRLYIGTIGPTYMVTASSEGGPLTPNDFNVQHVSAFGSEKIKPVRADGQVLYIEFAARKLRELTFDLVESKAKSPDLLALADHLTEENQIAGLCYQQVAQPLVWLPLDSGEAIVQAYNRNEALTAWSRFRTDGCFLDFCAVPLGHVGRDRIFTIVEREGSFYLEYFDTEAQLNGRLWRGLYTDSAVVTTADANFQITGLPASLEGKTVKVIGDGFLYDDAVVTGGVIDVTPQIVAVEFEVGLAYQGQLITLEPRVPQQIGNSGTIKSWKKILVRIRQTLGIEVGQILREEETKILNTVDFRRIVHPITPQLPPQRGKVQVSGFGSDSIGRLVVEQNRPFPAEILSIWGELEIEDAPRTELFDEPLPVPPCVIPTPPPPPNECPTEPTLTHIDSGFTQIFLGTARYDTTGTSVAYYSGSSGTGPGSAAIVAFDMANAIVLWETYGNAYKWYEPAVDPANGDVYVLDQTVSPSLQAIVQIDPADGTFIRQGTTSATIKKGYLVMDHTTIFNWFSSSGLNIVSAHSVSSLTELWFDNAVGTSLGVGNRISGACVDGSGDLWIHTHLAGTVPNANVLIHFDKATGAKTAYDISAVHPAGSFASISYDPLNNNIVIGIGSATPGFLTSIFNLGTHVNTGISTLDLLFDQASAQNGIVAGRLWVNTATTINEYDALTGALIQAIVKTDIVGGQTFTNWGQLFMMEDLGCVHMNHGSFPSHPIGGVDKLCTTCPATVLGGPLSQSLLLQGRQNQQIQRNTFLVQGA